MHLGQLDYLGFVEKFRFWIDMHVSKYYLVKVDERWKEDRMIDDDVELDGVSQVFVSGILRNAFDDPLKIYNATRAYKVKSSWWILKQTTYDRNQSGNKF